MAVSKQLLSVFAGSLGLLRETDIEDKIAFQLGVSHKDAKDRDDAKKIHANNLT